MLQPATCSIILFKKNQRRFVRTNDDVLLVGGGGNLGGDGSGRRELPGHARASIPRDLPPGSPRPDRHRGGAVSPLFCCDRLPRPRASKRGAARPFPQTHVRMAWAMAKWTPITQRDDLPTHPILGISQPFSYLNLKISTVPPPSNVEWRCNRDDHGRVVLRLQPRGMVPGHVPARRPQQRPVRKLHPRDPRRQSRLPSGVGEHHLRRCNLADHMVRAHA